MSAYIEYTDVLLRTSDLSELIPEGKDEEDWVAEFIADASAQIDAALLVIYTTTQLAASDLIKRICFELTHYLILRENFRQQEAEVSGWVTEIRDEAKELLQKLIDGELSLDAATLEAAISSTSEDREREFTQTFRDSDGNVVGDSGSMEIW